jgi:hypothetical protein
MKKLVVAAMVLGLGVGTSAAFAAPTSQGGHREAAGYDRTLQAEAANGAPAVHYAEAGRGNGTGAGNKLADAGGGDGTGAGNKLTDAGRGNGGRQPQYA